MTSLRAPMASLALAAILLAACGASAPAVSPETPASTAPSARASTPASPGTPPVMVPPDGRTWFGVNPDWAEQTAEEVGESLGVMPAVWVQFVRFPLDDGARTNLEGFFEQVAGVGAYGLVTLEPHDGLDAVTPEAAEQLATLLDAAWTDHGVPTFVRFAHEMNGSWYPWAQQPEAYVDAFRTVAAAIHAGAPASAMVWAPNDGAGYPFTGGSYGAAEGSPEAAALDTDGDGALTRTDDPYAPYWPGDDVVDWVGMSVYFWGLEYPWGENEIAPEGRFAAQLTGQPTGAHFDEVGVPDFYATYADGHDKPMAVIETAALYDPAGDGPEEAEVKGAWFRQVFTDATREAFPRIGMINWFEWRKDEPEVGSVVDWRLGADPALAASLLDDIPGDWLLFAPVDPATAGE